MTYEKGSCSIKVAGEGGSSVGAIASEVLTVCGWRRSVPKG